MNVSRLFDCYAVQCPDCDARYVLKADVLIEAYDSSEPDLEAVANSLLCTCVASTHKRAHGNTVLEAAERPTRGYHAGEMRNAISPGEFRTASETAAKVVDELNSVGHT